MITLKNQYVLKLDLAHFKDFVSVLDLIDLLYVEDSAMTLPAIKVSFIIRNPEIIDYMNEGSILTVGIGKDELSMLDLRFRIVSDITNHRPSVGEKVTIEAIHDDYEFSEKQVNKSYKNMPSIDVVKTVAKKHFPIFKTNIEKTNDIQDWQQHDNPWNFLRNVCSQGFYNENTFLVSGFDNDTFYYYDFRKKYLESVKDKSSIIIFSKTASGGNVINYNRADIISSSGATSRVLGYNTVNIEYNWLDYTVKAYPDNLLSFTSLDTNKLPILDGVYQTSYKDLGTNNYSNTNVAMTHNAKNMILNGNTLIFISFGGQFKDLRLFDVVLIDNTGDPRLVGLSMVAKIAYQIVDNQLLTNVTLVRESINGIKGDVLQ